MKRTHKYTSGKLDHCVGNHWDTAPGEQGISIHHGREMYFPVPNLIRSIHTVLSAGYTLLVCFLSIINILGDSHRITAAVK